MMRKRLILVIVLLLLTVGGVAGSVFWALFQVPDFYEQAMAETPSRETRQEAAKEFVQRTLQLVDSIERAPEWSEEFQQQQINSWLAEELTDPKYAALIPPDISEPRISLEEGLIRLGFRVQHDGWKGIVSLRIRPWVPADNQLAVEVQTVRVGLVPYPLEDVLTQIVDQLRAEGWQVEWQQTEQNDVLIVHLDRGEADAPVLQALQVVDGAIRIQGRNGKSGVAGGQNLLRLARKNDGRRAVQ